MFVPKYKKKAIYKEWRGNIVEIIRKLCEKKDSAHWSTGIYRPYPYASQYIAMSKCSTVYEGSQEQEWIDDIG